jgi:biotin transport system substrate-specific component
MATRDLVRIALFAAVIGALGLLPKFDIPLAGGVPITAQTLGVMLAGVILGARNGALAMVLFLFVIALGVPLLAGGRGGLGVFYAPSAGFVVGFVPGAFVTGLVMARLANLPVPVAAISASMVGGILMVYALGIPVLAWKAGMDFWQAAAASLLFVPGDIIKAVVTGFIAEALSRTGQPQFPGRE